MFCPVTRPGGQFNWMSRVFSMLAKGHAFEAVVVVLPCLQAQRMHLVAVCARHSSGLIRPILRVVEGHVP